jgi:MscS family membrane protein
MARSPFLLPLDLLPGPLSQPGPYEILWGQWLALLVLALSSWAGGRALRWLTLRLARRVAARTSATWDDLLVERLSGPVSFGWGLLLFRFVFPSAQLYPEAASWVVAVLKALGIWAVAFAAWRAVDVVSKAVLADEWSVRHPTSRALVPLGGRAVKVALVALALVSGLSLLGFPVASLLAGLGIGGLALALAGQKTVENLFGAFSLGLDQPIREGDSVRVDGITGTVEAIGLRSTRIRTADRTVVSFPNGRLADMRLENVTVRDRMQLSCMLGLTYGTTSLQVRAILENVEALLRKHPLVWDDTLFVCLKELGPSSLNLEVTAWFRTTDQREFNTLRQELLLGMMEVVEAAGSSLAFPTQTVHLVHAPPVVTQQEN